MKKIFSILVAAWMGVSAMAATITIEGSEFTGGDANNGKGAHVELKKDGITISTESGYADGKVLRVYQGGVVTITSTEVMTSIDFTCAKDYVALDDATPNSTTYSVTVPTGGKHSRIEKIVITTNGEGGGTDPAPDPSDKVVNVSANYAQLVYYADLSETGAENWELDLVNFSDDEDNYSSFMYFNLTTASKTSIKGTYTEANCDYYYTGVDFINGKDTTEIYADDKPISLSLTYKGQDEDDYPIYAIKGSFVGEDGKTYTISEELTIYAFDYDTDAEIVLNENGSTPDPDEPAPTDAITVAEALEIGNALANNTSTKESYTVVGYVGKIAKDYDTEKGDQCWFMTDDKNFTDSTYFEFEAYWCYINEPVAVGDYVSVTGPITKYVSDKGYTTIEIKNGQAQKISAPMGLENAETDAVVVKRIENGQLIIRRGEKRYNVVGQEL